MESTFLNLETGVGSTNSIAGMAEIGSRAGYRWVEDSMSSGEMEYCTEGGSDVSSASVCLYVCMCTSAMCQLRQELEGVRTWRDVGGVMYKSV